MSERACPESQMVADLENRRTHEANHNALRGAEVLFGEFRQARAELLAGQLEAAP